MSNPNFFLFFLSANPYQILCVDHLKNLFVALITPVHEILDVRLQHYVSKTSTVAISIVLVLATP